MLIRRHFSFWKRLFLNTLIVCYYKKKTASEKRIDAFNYIKKPVRQIRTGFSVLSKHFLLFNNNKPLPRYKAEL